jgi:outer membrane protein
MKKVLSILVAVSFILCAASTFAADTKIGFINAKDIVLNSNAGKAAFLELKSIFEKKKILVQEKENELKKMKEDLDKQRSILKEDAYNKKELEYQKNLRDYKRFIEDTNEEMRIKDQELSQRLIPGVLKIAKAVGEEDGYTVIMDISTNGLIFYSPKNDITKKVMEKYNKTYKSKK